MKATWTRTAIPCPVCGPGKGIVKEKGNQLRCFHGSPHDIATQATVVALRPAVPDERIEQAHRALLADTKWMNYLTVDRMLSLDTIREAKIGLIAGELQLSYPDGEGGFREVKRHVKDAKGHRALRWASPGAVPSLYPLPLDTSQPVLVTEGEWDTLLARGAGFNAVCGGAGATAFLPEWAKALSAAPEVFVCLDVDEAGTKGVPIVASALAKAGLHQDQIKVVRLPGLNGTRESKDLTDWWKKGNGAKELNDLLVLARPWMARPEVPDDEQVHALGEHGLALSGSPEWAGKWCSFRATVAGQTEDPWLVPTELSIDCSKSTDFCRQCKVFRTAKPETLLLKTTTPEYLDLVATPLIQQAAKVKAFLGIPWKCPAVSIVPKRSQNIYEVRLNEQFRLDGAGEESTYHAFSLGHDVKAGETYEMVARAMSDPRNQLRVHVIREVKPSADDLSAYQHDPKSTKPVMRKKKEKLEAHVSKLLDDLARITGHQGRADLHFLYVLLYLSVQWIQWDERRKIKGWLDVLVLGDSGQGKSTTAEALIEWTGLGDIVSLKRVTEKALAGGQVYERGKSWVNPGLDCRYDQRLVFYDEVKGASTATVATLTHARSSGWAEVATVRHRKKVPARVRRGWLTNLRAGKNDAAEVPLASLGFPCVGIPKVFGSLEDVRRLDAALVLLTGEVDTSNAERSEPLILSRVVLRALVLRAWTMPVVSLSASFRLACQRHAAEMAKRYAAEIPLVEATDQREKLARLAVSLANLVCEEPAEEHVDFVAAWLEKIYSSKAMGYADFSQAVRDSRTVLDPNVVKAALREALGSAAKGSFESLVKQLLGRTSFTSFQFKDLFPNKIDGDLCLSTLVIQNALRDNGHGYVKTEGFAELLKEWGKT